MGRNIVEVAAREKTFSSLVYIARAYDQQLSPRSLLKAFRLDRATEIERKILKVEGKLRRTSCTCVSANVTVSAVLLHHA